MSLPVTLLFATNSAGQIPLWVRNVAPFVGIVAVWALLMMIWRRN
jgi:hypothetical protein